jgi:hypothetical protein
MDTDAHGWRTGLPPKICDHHLRTQPKQIRGDRCLSVVKKRAKNHGWTQMRTDGGLVCLRLPVSTALAPNPTKADPWRSVFISGEKERRTTDEHRCARMDDWSAPEDLRSSLQPRTQPKQIRGNRCLSVVKKRAKNHGWTQMHTDSGHICAGQSVVDPRRTR